jgi:hypothetical protein
MNIVHFFFSKYFRRYQDFRFEKVKYSEIKNGRLFQSPILMMRAADAKESLDASKKLFKCNFNVTGHVHGDPFALEMSDHDAAVFGIDSDHIFFNIP